MKWQTSVRHRLAQSSYDYFIWFNFCLVMRIHFRKQRLLDFDIIRNITLPKSKFTLNYMFYLKIWNVYEWRQTMYLYYYKHLQHFMKTMTTIVMDKEVFLINTVLVFFCLVQGHQRWEIASFRWNRTTDFVRDYQSGHSSFGNCDSDQGSWPLKQDLREMGYSGLLT